MTDTLKTVSTVIADYLGFDPASLDATTDFDALGLDSLDRVEVAIRVERACKIKLDLTRPELGRLDTAGKIVEFIDGMNAATMPELRGEEFAHDLGSHFVPVPGNVYDRVKRLLQTREWAIPKNRDLMEEFYSLKAAEPKERTNMETEGLKATEAECAEGRTAPRVSLDDIKANIAEEFYLLGIQAASAAGAISHYASMDTLTICIIVLRNGFTIIGKSAPADPRNFDPLLGRKLAYEDAVRQVWPLMGYALREHLHRTLNSPRSA